MDERTLTADRPWVVTDFRAMGSRCRIVASTATAGAHGRAIVERLEQSWTRFRPDSELNHVNANLGRLCLISDDLHEVLKLAEHAHSISNQAFDIRCLDAVEHAGYRDSLGPDGNVAFLPRPHEDLLTPDGQFLLFDEPCAVLVPSGHRLDLGGIGKGFAADLVADALMARGEDRVQVEMGGDIRVAGPAWGGGPWTVDVEDPRDRDRVIRAVDLDAGAVATSSILRRRFRTRSGESHDLIDIRTMRAARTDLVAVTAIASHAWLAEVAAKCALISGRSRAAETIRSFGVRALLFTDDGTIEEIHP